MDRIWVYRLMVFPGKKTGQNAVRFCFFVFAWARPVLASQKKVRSENNTEKAPRLIFSGLLYSYAYDPLASKLGAI